MGKSPLNFTVLYEPYFRSEIKASILKDLISSKSSLCFIQICPIYLINVLISYQQDNVWHRLGILQVLIWSVYLWLKHTQCRMSLGLLTWTGLGAIVQSFWHKSDGVLHHSFSPAQESPSKAGESLHKNCWQEMAAVIHLPNSVLWGCATHGPAALQPVQRFWNVYKSFFGGCSLCFVFFCFVLVVFVWVFVCLFFNYCIAHIFLLSLCSYSPGTVCSVAIRSPKVNKMPTGHNFMQKQSHQLWCENLYRIGLIGHHLL